MSATAGASDFAGATFDKRLALARTPVGQFTFVPTDGDNAVFAKIFDEVPRSILAEIESAGTAKLCHCDD
jgi:hypothetical protein